MLFFQWLFSPLHQKRSDINSYLVSQDSKKTFFVGLVYLMPFTLPVVDAAVDGSVVSLVVSSGVVVSAEIKQKDQI